MSVRYDFTIRQGETWLFPVTLQNLIDSTPFDLSDYFGRGQIRRHRRSPDIVAELTVTIDADPTTGRFMVSLTAEQTSNIPAGETVSDPSSKYVYDIELYTESDAIVKRILDGFIYIDPEVTKP